MKIYHIPRSNFPLRIQISDDEIVACLQFRDERGDPFYWKLISIDNAKRLIYEYQMVVAFTLPDRPDDVVLPEDPSKWTDPMKPS